MAVGGPGRVGPTLDDVAERAGVGRGTVSRVLNGSTHVSDQAKAAVRAAVRELGYLPNSAARALVGSRTDAIALVIPEPESKIFAEPFFLDTVRGASNQLADSGVQLLMMFLRTPKERRRLVHYLRAHRVDGALLVSLHKDDPLPDLLSRIGLPIVLSGRRTDAESMSYVDADNTGGARSAATLLFRQGRRAVATITGPPDMYVARCRLDGYRQAVAVAGAGADESLIEPADFTEEGGRVAMRAVLERRPDVDAVFAASDVMAFGALQALRETGRRVPDDVALIGFDDSAIARHTDPPLTSVRQPTADMGGNMARLLLDAISGRSTGPQHLVLPTELVRRRSA